MPEEQRALDAQWNKAIAELMARSQNPHSPVPSFSRTQRAFLSLGSLVEVDDAGWAVVVTPHQKTRHVIGVEMGPYLTEILSEIFQKPINLTVTVDPAHASALLAPSAPTQAPADAPTPQAGASQAASAQPGGFQQPPAQSAAAQQSTQHPAPEPAEAQPPDQLASVSHPQQTVASPGASAPEWDTTHAEPTVGMDRADAASSGFAPGRQPQHPQQQQHHQPQRLPREKPAHDPDRRTALNPDYTFENFVIGSSNRFANGAAVAVAENPAQAYNPLFIAGGSGLGKTHLLHAIGNYAKVLQPQLRVRYISSEEFTNDYVNSMRDGQQEAFKRRYRNLDILMVDDIQFLQGKESTQEEFFHTFNALHQANKQIVLSSDRPPKELVTLEDRLRTRFQAGLIADIQPPDLETRIAILMKKAEADNTQVDREVLELIASRFQSSIRELEGALVRVTAVSALTQTPIDVRMAQEALHDILPEEEDVQITPAIIMEITAEEFDITVDQLTGRSKKRALVHPRQIAMYLCRELTDLSLPRIGEEFGGRDHTTVIYAESKIKTAMQEHRDTYDKIQRITQIIKTRCRA